MQEQVSVKLKNGSEIPLATFKVFWISILELLENNPVPLFELVALCRDPKHQPFGADVLERRGFTKEGVVPTSVKNIILSMAQGEELDMVLINPWTDDLFMEGEAT